LAITNVEQSLRRVVPIEMPASWHEAALRAQAIAARSYVLAGDGRHQPFEHEPRILAGGVES
jgi:SpoIID/LytB domain protein